MQKLTRNERRYLARFECGLCEQRLDRPYCCALFETKCTEETMQIRREKCLEGYKPRQKKVEQP